MPKTTTRYVCQTCGHESPRWLGKCTECGEWNSFVEEVKTPSKASGARPTESLSLSSANPVSITRVPATSRERMASGIGELDRVLGGGIVPGALMLVGGDPGIGKSTLMTQAAHRISSRAGAELSVLYVSGEESAEQIRLRAERLSASTDRFLVVNETDINVILHHIDALKPSLVVVDSIQTTTDPALESAPGTVSQVRSCASALARMAKSGGPSVFLVGHVTKEGSLAGPRVLEHMVDTVLYFEGDRHQAYRILRAVKNRFGSTDEIGIFEMREEGLVEVENPSAALLAERLTDSSGSAVTATMEGTRPLLVEIQALVARSFLANPRRAATGLDYNRLFMLLAVLEKRLGLRLGEQDVYVNVAGGVRIVEPAADLAVTMAVASSFREQSVDPQAILIGEVGLGGEIRAVSQTEKRIREAARMGFVRAVVAKRGSPRLASIQGVKVIGVNNVLEAMKESLLPASD